MPASLAPSPLAPPSPVMSRPQLPAGHPRRDLATRDTISTRRLLRGGAYGLLVALVLQIGGSAAALQAEDVTWLPATAAVDYPRAEVTYLHYLSWSNQDPARYDGQLTVFDEQVWWGPDGTALMKRCPRTEPAKTVLLDNLSAETAPCRDTTFYAKGQFAPQAAAPLPSETGQMRTQLARYGAGSGGEQLVRSVAALHREHLLAPRQRAAVLMALADVPELLNRGMTTDRAGRLGRAITLESGDYATGRFMDILILDDDTGELLDYEQVAIEPPGAQTPKQVAAFTVYLDARMVTTIPATPAAACTNTHCTTLEGG